MSAEAPLVLIVGGGITGLAAAWELTGGADGPARARVLLVEASGRLGGKVHTEVADGFVIEHGPDAFVAYRPAALELIREVGLADEVIGVAGPRTVYLRARGRLRPLPEGMGMVLPTRLGPFVGTRILTVADKLRAGVDLVLPRQLGPGDTSIGGFLRRRLGSGIVTRFADPMVGGIYGAGVDELSLDAVLPSLRANENQHRSLMLASLAQGRAARRGAATAGPSSPFRTLRPGLGALPTALGRQLAARGVDVRLNTTVASLGSAGVRGPVTATLGDGSTVSAAAVILAGGVASSAELLAGPHPDAAAALRAIPLASSAVLTFGFEADAFDRPPVGHGWLEADAAPISGATISSAKWAGRAAGDRVLVRAFAPERLDAIAGVSDEELGRRVLDHLGAVLGVRAAPVLTRITRWRGVMPKYTVGHLDRVAAVDAALGDGPIRVAGSALRGVGVPDCIGDGRRIALSLSTLMERSTP